MKYVFIVLIFCICTGIGIFFSQKYLKRKRFFSSLISLADKLSIQINFSRERLRVLIEGFDENMKKHLLGIDENFLLFLDKQTELSSEAIFKKADCLKNEEKEVVLQFLKTLGRSDVENQTKEIQGFMARFQEYKKKSDEEQKKYGSLAVKLGVIAGLFCAVILF